MAAGAISRAHVDVAVRCLTRIPRHRLTHVDDEGRSGTARVDAFLAEYARQVSPTDRDRLGAQLLAVLDPDGSDTFDPDAHHRRYLSYRTGPDGMLLGRFALDPGRADDSTGNPIAPTVLAQLMCGALLTAVLLDTRGAVLNLGRTTRLASPAQRRALTARDRGCVIPGCTVPAERCEAHHIVWSRNGGKRDIDNLAMLCGSHHTAVHGGHWQLTMIDGLPYAIGPPWADPTCTPRRNTLHTATAAVRRLGRRLRDHQLRFDLPGDDPPDPDP